MKQFVIGLMACILALTSTPANIQKLLDGEYNVDILMEGGTGRAHIKNPVKVSIKDNEAIGKIVWSSPNYDYMIVDGKTYYAEIIDDRSTFMIPITKWDEPVDMIADTTAMSIPHEISYQVTFYSDSLRNTYSKIRTTSIVLLSSMVLTGAILIIIYKKRKKNEIEF